MTILFRKCSQIRLAINKVAEVGVWKPEASKVINYIMQGIDTMLVEPPPKASKK